MLGVRPMHMTTCLQVSRLKARVKALREEADHAEVPLQRAPGYTKYVIHSI